MAQPVSIHLDTPSGVRLVATLGAPGAVFVSVQERCTGCRSTKVRGNGHNSVQTYDEVIEDAVCADCCQPRGRLTARMSILGRCRVY